VNAKAPPRTLVSFDWSALSTLRLRARALADGVYAGVHPSSRKGSGVEFGGHRSYVPGDDLRLLDRRAMARFDKPYIRELQTETDRALRVVLDASASMGFRGAGPVTKLAFAATLAAGLARVALSSGDPVGVEFLAGAGARGLPASAGREAFERLLGALEQITAAGDAREDGPALERALGAVARKARRGSILVFFSDLIDVHGEALRRFSALAVGGRTLLAVRVLDPEEALFPFEGPMKFRPLEGKGEVETDGAAVRGAYLAALGAIEQAWATRLASLGGRLITCTTDQDPVAVLRAIVGASSGGLR
jgi:uncharacterized protein (DUF58 family)